MWLWTKSHAGSLPLGAEGLGTAHGAFRWARVGRTGEPVVCAGTVPTGCAHSLWTSDHLPWAVGQAGGGSGPFPVPMPSVWVGVSSAEGSVQLSPPPPPSNRDTQNMCKRGTVLHVKVVTQPLLCVTPAVYVNDEHSKQWPSA